MAQPPPYDPADFTSKTFDENLLADIDTELANIQAVFDVIRANLEAIQRDDTKLANASVHDESLANSVLTLIGNWNPRGQWAEDTAYKVRDVVNAEGQNYIALADHTSSNDFPTDLGAGNWMATSGMTNPMTTLGDLIIGAVGGSPGRLAAQALGSMLIGGTNGVPEWLAKGTTGRHLRAGANGPEYGGAVDMNGAGLHGNAGNLITITAATDLNNAAHRASDLIVNNTTLTIRLESVTAYSAGFQTFLTSSDVNGGTITAEAGVTLNGVDGGTASIAQYSGWGLLREAADAWLIPNGAVS